MLLSSPTMEKSSLVSSLNKSQHEIVTADPSNMLVLAGAGSGKTRVLVSRIAWLIDQCNYSPYAVMAVTFTNKAAHEMRGRIESLLNYPPNGMWVGTFHGLAHRMLRLHWQDVGLPEQFQILDSDDQLRLIKRVQRSLNLDEKRWPFKQTQWFINKQKEEMHRSNQVENHDHSLFTDNMRRVYAEYEALCERGGLVDFGELLLRSLELLQKNDAVREHYQQRFRYILVDEFQDTNVIQYAWLKQFKADANNMIAVGDDDQSIYSWRGARVENMRRFTDEYPDVKTVRLEQNYRSTKTILEAANAVIANNSDRMGKELWTEGNEGQLITLYAAFNERDEAYFIASLIEQWIKTGRRAAEVAILYRSNAQSRVLEECLIDKRIPYRIYGGLKYFERAEIKDALAYLRLINNQLDDAAFERAVNMPPRGIGETTMSAVRTRARDDQTSLWQAAKDLIVEKKLSARACTCLQVFIDMIKEAIEVVDTATLAEQTDRVLMNSGLLEHYRKDRSEKGLSRVENLNELINAVTQFRLEESEEQMTILAAFLAHVALETGAEQAAAHVDSVSLMTLHSAKGLEFPLVFLTGMEEDLFPHKMALEENNVEEERRLCYVGMTRAMERLVITHSEKRRLHGMEKYAEASRFITEIPEEYINSERPKPKVVRTQYNPDYKATHQNFYQSNTVVRKQKRESTINADVGDTGLRVGQRVKHKKFGAGVIVNAEGAGEHARVHVEFDDVGAKWLVASYAKLESS